MRFYLPFTIWILLLVLIGCTSKKEQAVLHLHSQVEKNLSALYQVSGNDFLVAIRQNDTTRMRKLFLELRQTYKKVEAPIEYFLPGTAKGLNGAAITEVEAEEHKESEPLGLQVIEPFLFPEYKVEDSTELIRAARNFRAMVNRALQLWEVTNPDEKQWLDAAYYQLIRIAAMGITGFDTPICQTGVTETQTALQSLDTILLVLHKTPQGWTQASKEAVAMTTGISFDSFDRAAFLKGPWQKMFALLAQMRLQDGPLLKNAAILATANSLFGKGFLNPDFYAPDTVLSNPQLAQLGKKLFYDNRLSMNEKHSCATCHQPEKFFTDQLALSENIHGNLLSRNTPGLINTAFQTNYFWDMRVLNLEMQARSVIENVNEMHGSLDRIADKLNQDRNISQLFLSVFGGDSNKAVSPDRITHAIAAFQRTLSNFDSPFDHYMNGNDTAIGSNAIAGFNLFMGKAKCATCHFPPTFAGLVPPFYDKMESEVIGTPATAANNKKDPDPGRYAIHPVEVWQHSFKTPTVRNIEFTFPYMHNGAYQTLEQVVDFYNVGGGLGLGLDYPNQTLPSDSLRLTLVEKNQLIAFMKSLTAKVAH